MTLPLRRKHPTTAPSIPKGRAGTRFSFLRALAAGGISAAMALTSVAAEPDYVGGDEEVAVSSAQEEQPLAQAKVLRWKTSRISHGSEGATNLHSRSTTIISASHEESMDG